MKMKRILAVCLAAVIALSCCGCGAAPKTTAQVIEKMQAALAKTPCSHGQMVMDMTLALDSGEAGTLEMTVKTTNDTRVSQAPVSGYTTATVDVTLNGETSQSFTENYSVMEAEGLVSYIHSGTVWMRVVTGQTAAGLSQAASPAGLTAANTAIDETVTEYGGQEAVCLTTQITGDALQAALGGMLESIGQQTGGETMVPIDYTALTCDCRIYLDRDSWLPMAEEMTFSGMSDVLNPLYAQMGVQGEVVSCTASAAFLSYEAQDAFVLPEGAAEKAEKWTRLLSGEVDNGDGTFTIREGTAVVDVASPEGFDVSDTGYDHVCFKRDDHREVRYTVHYGTAASLTAKVDQQLARYGSLPKNVSRQQLTLEGDVLTFETDIVGVEWQSYEEGLMYGWADLGGDDTARYFLLVEVSDGYNDGLGHQKSADVTPEEFMAYLNGAAPSELMEG